MPKSYSRILAISFFLVSGIGASAQGARTTLDIFHDGQQVGADVFSARTLPGSDERAAVLQSRVSLRGTVSTLEVEAAFSADWQPLQFQMTTGGSDARRTWIQFGPRKITFRSIGQNGERARELPGRGRFVVVHDAVPSLYLVLAHLEPGELSAIDPEDGTIVGASLVDHGLESPATRPDPTPLRHLELRRPDGPTHVWFGSNGELTLLEIPAKGIRVSKN